MIKSATNGKTWNKTQQKTKKLFLTTYKEKKCQQCD